MPERVLQFGTGMLLRALCAASVDAANRAGAFHGRIVVVQSTPRGSARAINAQDGLFTLVERGLQNGAPIERTRLVGSIARALVADSEWETVREIAARPELQVIVSNVTEAGFRREKKKGGAAVTRSVHGSRPTSGSALRSSTASRQAPLPPISERRWRPVWDTSTSSSP